MLKGIGFALVVERGQLTGQRLPLWRKIWRSGQGRRPESGKLVRPLPRQRKGKTIEATKPERETSFEVDGRTIRAQSWPNLVASDCKVAQSHETFSLWLFFDPLYTNPLVLGTNMFLQPVSLFKFY